MSNLTYFVKQKSMTYLTPFTVIELYAILVAIIILILSLFGFYNLLSISYVIIVE